jgi:hypothetical protein
LESFTRTPTNVEWSEWHVLLGNVSICSFSKKLSPNEYIATMSKLEQNLRSGATALTKSMANFEAKASKVSSSNRINNAQAPKAMPSRPEKRKAEMMELSDDEPETITKRRPAPAPVSVPASASAPPPNKFRPWDIDHSTMKPPTNQAVSGTATTHAKKPVAELVELSTQQKEILNVVMDGKNVFFTGSAGMSPYYLRNMPSR